MPEAAEEHVLGLARSMGVIRPRDVAALGIAPGPTLHRLVRQGQLARTARGLYSLPDGEVTEHHTLVEVAKRAPAGVVCLLSALRFHDLGTQWPHEVWLAVGRQSAWPHFDYPATRIFRFSGEAFGAGVERHVIEGVPVQIYSAAKTVADCFKYRNKLGVDVALEALHEYIRKRVDTLDALNHYAEVCRVAKVIRPYVEASL